MTDLDVEAACTLAVALAKTASEVIRQHPPQEVTSKTNPADLCTEKDVEIEEMVRASILSAFPDHAFEGEELGRVGRAEAEHTWYLDPVDGTTNFASGLPWSSFSLALADGQGPVLGVVADPYRGDVATAIRDRGTYLGDQQVRTARATSVAGQVILTEWSGHVPWPGMETTLGSIARAYGTTRIMGSSALALYSVALGRAAGAIIGSFHLVDDLAGILLAQEAGAVVLERDGGLMVAAPGVADELSRLWVHGRNG